MLAGGLTSPDARGAGGAGWPPRAVVPHRDAARLGRAPGAETGTGGGVEIEGGAELAARVLLDRYGVVFRRL